MKKIPVMYEFFTIGDVIYGFCNGYFGRDDYDAKVCVLVTPKYAVFQWIEGEFEGKATVINNPENLCKEDVENWKKPMY